MRKYLVVALIGFSLSFTVSAHAAVENLIGRMVEGVFPVKVNEVQIDKQAIVIDGTSYLPVRAIGDALGMDITFNADLGIGLTQKAGDKMAVQQTNPQKIKPTHLKKVNSNNHINNGGDYGLIEIDGNQYANLSSLPFTITWIMPNAIFHNPDKPDITVTISDTYQPNIEGFIAEGSSYVKLSIFGLKATIQGDTLVIEKQ